MDNINEIKKQLDDYYKEYKDNRNSLSGGKTRAVAELITDMAVSKDAGPGKAAAELSRFSADVTNGFFDFMTNKKKASFDVLNEVLKQLHALDNDPRYSQYYVSKYCSAISSIMNCYKTEIGESDIIPELFVLVASLSLKSNKNKTKLYNLIANTKGEVFKLDYSKTKKESLDNIWKSVNNLYPDLSKAKQKALILDWANKYGFISEEAAMKIMTSTDTPDKTAKPENRSSDVKDKNLAHNDFKAKNIVSSRNDNPTRDMLKESYDSLKKELNILLSPIEKAIESIQGEISKSREIGSENELLKAKNTDMERQLTDLRTNLQETNRKLMSAKEENDDLNEQIKVLNENNLLLDQKLNDAYSINSREASMEAEKIRSELEKEFSFFYEDWLEYEFSDVSEDNYESLQAIIKKIFRSLDRNGINYKGNN